MDLLSRIVKNCLTGPDGDTYDFARVFVALAMNVGLALSVYTTVVLEQAFDWLAFGTGIGGLIFGGGLAIKMKENSEPPAADPPAGPEGK